MVTAQQQAVAMAKAGKLSSSCTKDCTYSEIMTEVDAGADITITINITLQTWYDEGIQYDYKLDKSSSSTEAFTALIWKSSRKLGVGVATRKSDNKVIIVFQFSPPGNVAGQFAQNVKPSIGINTHGNNGHNRRTDLCH